VRSRLKIETAQRTLNVPAAVLSRFLGIQRFNVRHRDADDDAEEFQAKLDQIGADSHEEYDGREVTSMERRFDPYANGNTTLVCHRGL
jgi:hypothetical protein